MRRHFRSVMDSAKITWLIIFLVLMLPRTGKAQMVDSLAELAKMYDSSRCKVCHAQIYEAWEKSLHAKPLIGPYYKTLGTLIDYLKQRDGELKKSKEVTSSIKEYMKPCFICHIPQMMELSEKGAQELAKACIDENFSALKDHTINCIVCHNRNAIIRKYRDGNPEKDAVYGTKFTGPHADKKYTKGIKNTMMSDPSFCGQCHQGPNILHSEEPIYCVSNLDSYLQAYIPNGGDKTCQNCHMEKTPEDPTGHRFPPNYDDPEFEMKRLRQHIKFDMNALAYIFRIKEPEQKDTPTLVVRTRVSHDIAHRFPDGCPSPTHFGLVVEVKDMQGKVLFSEKKYYISQLKLGYAKNEMVFASLRKLSLMRDTSLQPFRDNKEEFEFKLPKGVADVMVEASLYYWVEPIVPESKYDLYKITKKASIEGTQ